MSDRCHSQGGPQDPFSEFCDAYNEWQAGASVANSGVYGWCGGVRDVDADPGAVHSDSAAQSQAEAAVGAQAIVASAGRAAEPDVEVSVLAQ